MMNNQNRKIFEILYSNSNVEEGIQQALSMIGQRFSVSRVYIFESSEDGLFADNTFEWCNEGIEPQIEYLQNMSYEEYGYKDLFGESGLFFSGDVSKLEAPLNELFLAQGIKATIQYAMYDKGELRGFVGFDDCNNVRHDWDKNTETLDTLVFLSKLLTVYLLKERNLQKAVSYHEQMKQALDNETEANKAKSEFLSRMSHDIRTPLNGIIGMTEIVLSENRDESLQHDLEIIASSSKFLLSLINDVLDISRIESGKMQLHPVPVPLEKFDNMIKSVIMPLMNEKNITFEYKMNCGLTCAKMDEIRFNQIFFNLLSNAAKFTPKNGHIIFSAIALNSDDKTELVRFSVKDNGIGMTEEFTKRAFEPFEQMNEHGFGDQQRQGTGLGLAIVKELVALMGGKITVHSELGKGSEFIIDLPLERCVAPEKRRTNQPAVVGKPLLECNILLVEDNEVNMHVAKRLLEGMGASVACAVNGKEALRLFENSKIKEFDVILMDIRMPVMDGIEATKRIRSLEREDAKGVTIIAMSANAYEEDKRLSIECGMNDHLSKPVEPTLLCQTILKYVG